MFRNFKQILNTALRKHPLLANTGVTLVLMTSADYLEQNVEKRRLITKASDYDFERTKRIAIVAVVLGPLFHGWYKFLDTRFSGNAFKTIAKKLVLEQTIASPLLIAGYFLSLDALEGRDFKESSNELIKKFPFVYLVDCCVWIPGQAVNFYFLPPHFRVIFVNTILFCYNVFLSYAKHND